MRKWNEAASGQVQHGLLEKVLHWESDCSLEQAPQELFMPPSVSEFKEQRDDSLKSYGLVLGSPVRSRELDLMILMGSFQLEIFYESKRM